VALQERTWLSPQLGCLRVKGDNRKQYNLTKQQPVRHVDRRTRDVDEEGTGMIDEEQRVLWGGG